MLSRTENVCTSAIPFSSILVAEFNLSAVTAVYVCEEIFSRIIQNICRGFISCDLHSVWRKQSKKFLSRAFFKHANAGAAKTENVFLLRAQQFSVMNEKWMWKLFRQSIVLPQHAFSWGVLEVCLAPSFPPTTTSPLIVCCFNLLFFLFPFLFTTQTFNYFKHSKKFSNEKILILSLFKKKKWNTNKINRSNPSSSSCVRNKNFLSEIKTS